MEYVNPLGEEKASKSGMGVINSLQTMLLMPITGLNQGVQPIISFNFGARKYGRVKTAVKLASPLCF